MNTPRPESGKRTALVGGSGFIGSWLTQALVQRGCEVTVLDIEEPTVDVARISYRRCDVRRMSDLAGALDGFDLVYLLASLLSKRCDEEPANGWRTNVGGTVNALMEMARNPPPPRIVYFSSSMVYSSKTTICPLPETAPVAGERLYDQSKLAGETMIRSFCLAHRSNGIILRPFSVYGPGKMSAEKGHFLGIWRERANAGLPLTVHGEGTNSVDLLHIDDLGRACLLASGAEMPASKILTFNVGSGQDAQVKTIAGWIQDVRPEVQLEFGPPRPHTIPRRWADIERASKVLGYRPEVPPEEGVKRLFQRKGHASRGGTK